MDNYDDMKDLQSDTETKRPIELAYDRRHALRIGKLQKDMKEYSTSQLESKQSASNYSTK